MVIRIETPLGIETIIVSNKKIKKKSDKVTKQEIVNILKQKK